ncbi:MAG: sulfotransferase, partial [Verrucomicrobiota bacterium]
MSERPLLCVVTGMEHSGTTFLSKLLTAHPTVNAAFECGILLGENPREVLALEPWSDWFVTPIEEGHWGLTLEQFEEVAAASDWDGAYAKVIEHCPLFQEGENRIVDKSPRYLQDLPE